MGRPLGEPNTKAYSALIRKKIISEVQNANYLIPRKIPYNGGMEKNCQKAIQLLEQIEASLVNYKWISSVQLREIKRGN